MFGSILDLLKAYIFITWFSLDYAIDCQHQWWDRSLTAYKTWASVVHRTAYNLMYQYIILRACTRNEHSASLAFWKLKVQNCVWLTMSDPLCCNQWNMKWNLHKEHSSICSTTVRLTKPLNEAMEEIESRIQTFVLAWIKQCRNV